LTYCAGIRRTSWPERSTGGRCDGNKIRPVTTKEKIVVGGRVPADVELEAVPADWGPSLTKYRYVYSGDRVILVDPGSRTVVQEVD
jgi:Protein of unknown function (DUF1236)